MIAVLMCQGKCRAPRQHFYTGAIARGNANEQLFFRFECEVCHEGRIWGCVELGKSDNGTSIHADAPPLTPNSPALKEGN